MPQELPPLSQAWPAERPLPDSPTRSHALLLALRELAERLRDRQARRFYSTRAVAGRFGVHQTTVVRVFAELEREGLLVRLRGSGTLLRPLRLQPRIPVRGVVGVPIWLLGHSLLSDWRVFFTQLEEHLRRRHYVADLIFYRMEEPGHPDFAERLIAHDLDALVWFKPLPAFTMNLQRLADGGVTVAVLPEKNIYLPFPAYSPSLEAGTRQALAAWRRDGVSSVTIVGSDTHPEVQRLRRLLEAAGMDAEVRYLAAGQPGTWAGGSKHGRSRGMIFADDLHFVTLCQSQPDAVISLLRDHRVLLRQYVEMHRDALRGCRLDMVLMDWAAFAARIADDLAAGKLPPVHARAVVEARFIPRTDAARFAQAL